MNIISKDPRLKKEALNWMGELAIIHATGKETKGKFCMIELFATKQGSPPWHIHHREDEGFYIIEGELTIHVGADTYHAKAGDFLVAPKNIPHTYVVESKGHARILMICWPSGFEDLVRALSSPTQSMLPPEPESAEVDFEKIANLAFQYGVEIIDPPTG